MEYAEYTRKAREKYFEEHLDAKKDGGAAPEPVPAPMETEIIPAEKTEIVLETSEVTLEAST